MVFKLQARFGDQHGEKTMDEKKIMEHLRNLVKNPMDCFIVDQLLFLEEQAKVAEAWTSCRHLIIL